MWTYARCGIYCFHDGHVLPLQLHTTLRSMDGDAAFTFGSHFNSSNGEKETQRRRHILAPMSYTWQNDVGRDIRYCCRRPYRSDNGAMHTEQTRSIGLSWGFQLLRPFSGIAHVVLRYCLAFREVKTVRIDVTQLGIEIKVIENILFVTVGSSSERVQEPAMSVPAVS